MKTTSPTVKISSKPDSVSQDRAGALIPWTEFPDRPSDERVVETAGLVEALGYEAAFVRPVQLRKPNAAQLLSGGILTQFAQALSESGCTLAIIDAALTPVQQRNLENELGLKVIDRTGLILEIFGLRARTREGVLQVEYARLMYERSRLVRTWTHLERQRGGGGFLGGPGETQLESDRRMLDRDLMRLRRDLEDVKRTRAVQRSGRQKKERPLVALVGYTNVGKSTLFNALSKSDVLAQDMPFATLDSTIRNFELPTMGPANLVDTVGFITALPTHLIESFQATLEETLDADLVLHVQDRSHPDGREHQNTVMRILLNLSDTAGRDLPPILDIWNKIDLLPPSEQEAVLEQSNQPGGQGICISAASGNGLEHLLAEIENSLLSQSSRQRIEFSTSRGDIRSWAYRELSVLDEATDDCARISLIVRMTEAQNGRLTHKFGDAVSVDTI